MPGKFWSAGLWARGFWSPGFWAGLASGDHEPFTGKDADIIDDVIARLMATGHFDDVAWGEDTDRRGRHADHLALAIVEPDTWAELDEFDDAEDYESVCRNTFRLALYSRDQDPRTRDRKLDRMLQAAKNAINEQALAGITIPGLTILRRGKYEKAMSPERRMTVVGEYAYFVDGPENHDTSE